MSTAANRVPVELSGSSIVIPAAAGDSNEFPVGPFSIVGLIFPASVVSTSLTIKGSQSSGGTFTQIFDSSGNALTISCGASRIVYLEPSRFGVLPPYIKLTTAATEGATRTVRVLVRPIL